MEELLNLQLGSLNEMLRGNKRRLTCGNNSKGGWYDIEEGLKDQWGLGLFLFFFNLEILYTDAELSHSH